MLGESGSQICTCLSYVSCTANSACYFINATFVAFVLEDLGVPFFTDHIRALTVSFDSIS